MRMILVTGYKGEGKDTVAEYIINNYNARSLSLAHPIKTTAMDWLDATVENVHGSEKEVVLEEFGITTREFLQFMGTDVMQFSMMKRFKEFKKRVGRTFWCRLLLRRAKDYAPDELLDTIVLSDVRFPHEVEFFKKKVEEAFVIRVMRHTIPWYKKLFWHSSEKMVDKIKPDVYISNTSNVEKLYEKVDIVMALLGLTKGDV